MMNDQTLDQNEANSKERKKSNEMDSMIIEHKKMIFPQTNLPLSESHLGTTESFRHDNIGLMRRHSEDGDITPSNFRINKQVMRFETSLSINMYQIKDMFRKVCRKRGFDIIDDEREQVTAMAKHLVSIKDICTSCFKGKFPSLQVVTALRLTSKTNKITCHRKIVLKGLIGVIDNNLIVSFLNDFKTELVAYDSKRSISPQKTTGTSFFSDQILSHSINNIKTSRYTPIIEEGNSDGEEVSMSPQNLESYSFYEFRKILSSDQYAIGKKVAEFLRDFFEAYGYTRDAANLLPQPMEKIFHKINETTETFFADFNYGKSETRKMMPFCKTSVEKYIFDKVFTHLFDMYVIKYEKQSAKFRQKTQEILRDSNPLKHLKFLDIPAKFWLIPPEKLNENKELKEPLKENELPYIDAINEFSKITKLRSPKEKLSVLLMVHSLMKSTVVEYHKGKREIASMDEELPILIYVMLNTKVDMIVAELNFVDDYVQLDPSLESEKRLMTNIKVSVQYISDEWRVD